MLKKMLRLLSSLVFLLLVTACAGEEGHGHTGPVATLDRSQWPTPAPVEAMATPTPFPIVNASIQEALDERQAGRLAARDRAVAQDAVAQNADQAGQAANIQPATATAEPSSVAIDDSATATVEPPAEALLARVNSIGLNLRQGPGANFQILYELRQGDQVTILAADDDSAWLKVSRSSAGSELVGWVNSQFLTVEGELAVVQDQQTTTAIPAAVVDSRPEAANTAGRLLIQLQAGGDIMIINRDGSGLHKISAGLDPALSPDGDKIAFTRWDSAQRGSLWLANSDGSGERVVIGDIKQAKSPSWSPDSRRIALNFQEGGRLEVQQACQSLLDGRPDINFWLAYDIEIRGYTICWKMPPDPHWQLRVIDLTTGQYEDLPAGLYAFAPTWDPANSWRVVSADRLGLVWTDVNRGHAQALTNDPSDRAPTFSPNGDYIAVTYKQDNHWDVHRLNADGTGRVRLTKTPLYALADGDPVHNNVSPAFSPEGSEIAFLTDRTGRWEVWVMNLDGTNQRPMFAAAVNDQLEIFYSGNDARMLGWGR